MRRLLPLLSLGLACCARPPAAPPPPPPPQSAPTPWVAARPARDLAVLEAPARVLASPGTTAEVVPPFRARVVRIHVRPGQRVERGALIMDVIMPEVVRAAGAYVAATTRLQAYGRRREQLVALRGEGLVRLVDLAEAETKVAEALSDQQAALGTLRSAELSGPDAARLLGGSGTLPLRAPIGGVVTALRAALGETHDNTDMPLAQIAGSGDVQVEARLSRPLPPSARLSFVTPAGEVLPLRLLSRAPVVDPRDGTTLAWFAPDEGARLPGGLSGKLRASLAGERDVVAVPARALLRQETDAGPGTAVLVRRGAAQLTVPVEVLATSGSDAVVRGALSAGDEVAADASVAQEQP